MKNLLVFFFLNIIVFNAYAQDEFDEVMRRAPHNFYKIQKAAEEHFREEAKEKKKAARKLKVKSLKTDEDQERDSEYMKFKRWEWYWRDRVLPDGSFPDLGAIDKENARLSKARTTAAGGTWSCFSQYIGDHGYSGMGRATSIAFHPTNKNIFYVGAPIGGIWKTTDGGLNYTPLGDQLTYVSTGDIAVDYNTPTTIYITIGDNTGWWNPSLGVMKSTDGGVTWNTTGLTFSFNAGIAIYRMAMSPTNPGVLLAATTDGLYRTANGGTTWTRVRTGSHGDIEFKPGDGNTIYATTDDYWGYCQVWKSTDAGVNWIQVSSFSTTNSFLRLAVTPANPNKVAVLMTNGNDVYVSPDGGTNWTYTSDCPENTILYISPVNENIIYTGYVNVYRSNDGGYNWTKITHWHGGMPEPEVHADHHFVNHNPVDANALYFCCDGGVYRHEENTTTWTEFTDNLVITQFYRLATAQNHAEVVIGGTQDNGGRKRTTTGTWTYTNGGDAMEVAIDPTNYNIIYTTYVNGQLYRSLDGWTADQYYDIRANIPGAPDGDWVAPYVLDPNNSSTIVAGYKEVYRSTNRGDNWTQISSGMTGGNNLHCIAVAKGNSSVIYTSRDDIFYRTTNMGTNWTTLTVPNGERITSITIDPNNSSTVYITRSGYNAGNKVFKSTNGGTSWTNITGTLPNVPFNGSVYYEASTNEGVFIGGDRGVYYRNSTMSDWVLWGNGLPNTSVTDLEIYKAGKKLRISTFGRGLWELDIADVPLPAEMSDLYVQWSNINETKLWWNSYRETNFRGYQILQSFDGKEFKQVNFLDGRNTNGLTRYYEYSDTVPATVQVVYYKLGREDDNGLIYYTNPVKLERFGEQWVQTIYPVPAQTEINIAFNNIPGQIVYAIHNAEGKEITTATVSEEAQSLFTIPLSGLSSGQYILSLKGSGKSYSAKFTVK